MKTMMQLIMCVALLLAVCVSYSEGTNHPLLDQFKYETGSKCLPKGNSVPHKACYSLGYMAPIYYTERQTLLATAY